VEVTILKDVNRGIKNTTNKTFKVNFHISQGDNPNPTSVVSGWNADEKFSEKLSSEYTPLFSKLENINNLQQIMTAFGMGTLRTIDMYRKIWIESKPPSFTFNLLFQSEDDARTDVYEPIRLLQRLVVPNDTANEGNNYFLSPPMKPVFRSDTVKNTSKKSAVPLDQYFLHSIEVGNFITMKHMIIDDISVDWHIQNVHRPTRTGKDYPNTADVTVSCSSVVLWTLSLIDNLVKNNLAGLDDKRFKETIVIEDLIKSITGGMGDMVAGMFGKK
jgi:hypothetical protein